MKKFIIYIGLFIVCYSFISKPDTKPFPSNKKLVHTNLFTSTLDSLQGTWVLDLDPKYKFLVSGNKLYDTYDNMPNDTSNILFANDCIVTPISFYNKSQVNGKYLIEYKDGYEDYDYCFKIGYLSNTSLELICDGKHSGYTKQ